MRLKALLVLALLALGNPAFARLIPKKPVLLSISGEDQGVSGTEGIAVGFALSYPTRGVTIAARLSNGGGFAGGTAYLMRSVGPGVTPQEQVATTTVDLPFGFYDVLPLFTDLDLPAGEYWLLFAAPKTGPFSYLNWSISQPIALEERGGLRYVGTRTALLSNPDYPPAAPFGETYTGYGYQIEVSAPFVPGHNTPPWHEK